MTTLQRIRAEIQKVLDKERDFSTESAKAQAMALMWCLEIIDRYASEECDNDCEHCAYIECPKEPSEDAVSRKAVIDALYELFDVKNDRLVQIPWYASAIDARINALPSVQPKQNGEDEPKQEPLTTVKCYERDCNNCTHYVYVSDGQYGCESWECEYEPVLPFKEHYEELAEHYDRRKS